MMMIAVDDVDVGDDDVDVCDDGDDGDDDGDGAVDLCGKVGRVRAQLESGHGKHYFPNKHLLDF